MARYTKIPEIDFAGALSTSLGGLSGTVISKAEKVLLSSKVKLSEMAIAAFKEARKQALSDLGCLDSYNTLSRVTNGLSTISSSYSAVLAAVNAMKVTAQAMMVPIEALEAAILVIKMIPLPQMYLVVSITTVFSDTLEMLSELVAQTKEIVDSALDLLDVITKAFDPIKSSLDKIQTTADTLKADQSLHCALSVATEEDLKNLQRLGIIDSLGDSIFNKLGQDAVDKGYISFGDVEEPSKDTLGKLKYLNKLGQNTNLSGKTGTAIEDNGGSRDGITSGNETGDSVNDGRALEGKGDVLSTEDRNGKSSNSFIPTFSQNIPTISLDDKNLFGVQIDGSDAGSLDGKILLISSTSDIHTLLSRYLSELDDASYVGSEIKDIVKEILNSYPEEKILDASNSNDQSGIEFYRTPTGELLTLEVVKDETSPKIAIRRYAVAKTQDGVVVSEGVKSFTLDPQQLIEDLKLKLSQLFV